MISIRINIVENTHTDFNLLSLPNEKTPNILGVFHLNHIQHTA